MFSNDDKLILFCSYLFSLFYRKVKRIRNERRNLQSLIIYDEALFVWKSITSIHHISITSIKRDNRA